MNTFPVILRMEGDDVVAFFPYAKANFGYLVCYAHLGQHGEADLGYYHSTKAAKLVRNPKVDDLLAELKSIYETGEDAVTLRVMRRLPLDFRDHAWSRS